MIYPAGLRPVVCIHMQYGRYQTITQIGEGGMAKVYLAEDPTLNRLVAVKVIHQHLTSNQAMQQRFAAEAKIAAALKNPHIVEIYDYGIEKGNQYFIMEYIDGPTLEYIGTNFNKKGLPQKFCASVICQAAEGLAAAENQNIVHRDIKPSNLMFTTNGILKIADFGIAKLGNVSQVTHAGTVVGTPHFISPEQYNDEQPSPASDLWALGVIFYYCLAGKLPFQGENLSEIINKVCNKEHQSLMSELVEIDPELSALVDLLLKKKPEQRGKGAEWLESKLRQYLGAKGLFNPEEGTKLYIENLGPFPNQALLDEIRAATDSGFTSDIYNVSDKLHSRRSENRNVGTHLLKNPFFIIIMALVAGLGTFFLSNENFLTEKKISIDEISVFPETPIIQLGEKLTLRTMFKPVGATGDVIWETNKPEVISVTNGVVFGTTLGKAIVRALDANNPIVAGSSLVRVIPPSVERVKLSENRLNLRVGEKHRLQYTVSPDLASKAVRWSTFPSGIIHVSNGNVIARRAGSVILTVKSKENDAVFASCEIIVKPTHTKSPAKKTSIIQKSYIKVASAPPFATVRINNKTLGKTPMRKYHEVKPGLVTVEIMHRSLPPLDTTIHLKRGEKYNLFLKLIK